MLSQISITNPFYDFIYDNWYNPLKRENMTVAIYYSKSWLQYGAELSLIIQEQTLAQLQKLSNRVWKLAESIFQYQTDYTALREEHLKNPKNIIEQLNKSDKLKSFQDFYLTSEDISQLINEYGKDIQKLKITLKDKEWLPKTEENSFDFDQLIKRLPHLRFFDDPNYVFEMRAIAMYFCLKIINDQSTYERHEGYL